MKAEMKLLRRKFGAAKIERVLRKLRAFKLEVPSWGFGRGGTRFGSFADGSEAKTIFEKVAAAGRVKKRTGVVKSVALHIPWDECDYARLKRALAKAGLKAGTINSNTFQPREAGPLDWRLRYGSLTNPRADVRNAAVEHNIDCIRIAKKLDSRILTIWLPDGTNSPGQLSLYTQAELLEDSLRRIYRKLAPGMRMLLEYKFFEPAFYATALPDYGRAAEVVAKLGPKASVLVDTGHHPLGANIEQIVTFLVRSGRLGGFHFNDHKYADDDLAAGSIDPAQLFRIFLALVEGEARRHIRIAQVAFMIDQSHNIKDPVEEMVESVDNIMEAYAKALLVDLRALWKAQNACDASGADAVVSDAFKTDVRPLVKASRGK